MIYKDTPQVKNENANPNISLSSLYEDLLNEQLDVVGNMQPITIDDIPISHRAEKGDIER